MSNSTICFTEGVVSRLIDWRNSQEDNSLHICWHFGKIFATELALPVAAISAAAEASVYSLLYADSTCCQCITEKPKTHYLQLINSSTSTACLSASFLVQNITRLTLQQNAQTAQQVDNPLLELSFSKEQKNQAILDGSTLLQSAVSGMDPATQQAFVEFDSDVVLLVLTRALWVFISSPEHQKTPLDFFLKEQRAAIQNLRKTKKTIALNAEIDSSTYNIDTFDRAIKNTKKGSLFSQLLEIAYSQQHSLLATKCWGKLLNFPS
jgi:hypothetical protein